MKRLLPNLGFISVILLIAGCGDKSASQAQSREYANDSTTLTNIAWQLHDEGAPLDSCISVQQQAVDKLHSGDSNEDPVAVLEQMGMFQMAKGQFDKSMHYYMEARDSMLASPPGRFDPGAIKLYGDISLLWQRLGALPEALAYNDSAMAESRKRGDMLMTDLYMFRADIYDEMGRPDSAVKCYDLALQSIDTRETNADKSFLRGWVNAEKGIYLTLHFQQLPDTIAHAVALIENALGLIGDESDTAMARFALGLGKSILGDTDAGLTLMEKAASELLEQADPEYYSIALKGLMRTYARLGMAHKLIDLYPEMEAATDSIFGQAMRESLAGAKAQYQMKSARIENELLQSQLAAAREHALVVRLVTILIILIVGIIAAVTVRVNRKLRLSKEKLDKDVKNLTKDRDQVLSHNDVLRKELTSRQVGGADVLSAPVLHTEKGIRRFKQVFEATYPDFNSILRQKCPKITAHDELLCMMIFIGYTTEESAEYLGLSRASVNTARYRLRQRMGLEKSIDLNEFIRSLLPAPAAE